MRTPGKIPPPVTAMQKAVSDPDVSAFVAANAGAGKTHVLAQRVINLLLAGTEPEKILCLTFTKAAAANMAKRVFDTLARWATLDDEALDRAVRDGFDTAPDAVRRVQARRLFARALEAPGGLKVQTIHAFCTQLLHQFPFEANVAARFGVLDEAEHTQLLERLTLDVLLDGAADPRSALGRALAAAMSAAADVTFRDLVRETIGRREAVTGWLTAAGGLERALADLSRLLAVDPSETRESVEGAFFAASPIAPAQWSAIAAALARGSKTDGERAQCFAALASLSGPDRVDMYLKIFCTGEGAPRKSIVTKAIKDAVLVDRLYVEQARICALLDRRRAIACRDRSAALLTVVDAVLTRYQREKARRGLLDYDDLIDKALDLLREEGAAWVHYKLDLGIDHLLIDEAQDTSKKQWEIVARLAAEFTAGAGARPGRRTIFAVGDEKQSIYSFQNAAPKEFADRRLYFQHAHANAGLRFISGKFEHSFRSGPSVLGAVDIVFKDIAASVTTDKAGFPPHLALADAPPSLVEIWEPERPDERSAIEGWDAPFDRVSETSPRVKLARRVARRVRSLLDRGEPVGIERRAASCGDFLILVRQRGELFEAIIRALKNEGVAVAGADRLVLAEHIAVMDLITLGDALLLAEDDLALAAVLRSPLFGFSDEDLFAVAWDRGALSLRAALQRKSDAERKFAAAATRLDNLAQAARRQTPFAFYAQILGEGGGRRQFLARLGIEANDALDEFLNLALEYERRQSPSLQGFLAWLREARAEVKRDMEIARDELRVMTVHGAKGLEAPIVILADTMNAPAGPPAPRLIKLANGALIWAGRKSDDSAPVAAARASAQTEAEDEYRRLLYVAMTRAADRLIVCGADGVRARPKGCWYDLIRNALAPHLVEEDDNGAKVWRYRAAASFPAAPRAAAAPVAAAPTTKPDLPIWFRTLAPVQTPQPAALSPAAAFEAEIGQAVALAATAKERRKALRRGLIVHRLMQSLPDIPLARRQDAAERYLKSAAADFAAAAAAEIVRNVLGILADPDFAQIFAPGSRAEVPIVGRIACSGTERIAVSGQVDRLAIAEAAVLIADYKTDAVPASRIEQVPRPYVAQLALYRALLGRLYPAKTVRAALIFTAGPHMIELPGAAMDAALVEIIEAHAAVKVP